tara:strand:- start:3887 stop:4882 length:996 start_codon:yes stop_codon:yes gene_type:complete
MVTHHSEFPKILLIGAGQLGSRYLQGLSQSEESLQITVVDPNARALLIAKERFEEMPKNPIKQYVQYHDNYKKVKNIFDLIIVSTNADVRTQIVKYLLRNFFFKYMILEKVAFQAIKDFQEIIELLKKKNVKAWINCPRRTYPFFKKLKKEISKEKLIRMVVKGSDWGLASNTIHMLDLLAFLSDQDEFIFDISELDENIYKSKRASFIELGGKLRCKSIRGDSLELLDNKKTNDPFNYIIEFGDKRIEINQDAEIATVFSKNGLKSIESRFSMPMQSEITTNLVKQILNNADSSLTTIQESFLLHRCMIEGFNNHLSKVLKKSIVVCPIT